MPFWFNVDTKQVETDETRGQGANVMGPYETHDEAANALEHAAANTAAWDEEDREWDAKGAAPSWDDEDLED